MMRQSPRKPEKPILWIIAGPDGSGKSSYQVSKVDQEMNWVGGNFSGQAYLGSKLVAYQ